jgi:hypothetical protein
MPFDIGLFGTSGPARFAARRIGPVPVPPATTNVPQPAGVTGRWENLRWNLDVWIIDLKATGNQLAGTVSMTAGPGREIVVDPSPHQLFAFIEAAAGRRPYALKVEYDATLGYPMFISLRQGGTSVDDDLEVRISGFRAVN